ncbi:MFS transporter [Lacticaseibacillus zhaodongensis]|uniref:MFS transporter n=1 Tax=Lacticaseibacillus zhaodongensis TaxID=2668065 RepID=UPI0012D360A5|nr:MFS transporter [Lacticaseibacillus zhaodongensis]
MSKTKTPARARLTFIMIYIGYIICFIDRSAISIALSYIGKDLHLSTATLGVVASAFFFSYALMQIPGGWLTDKFGTYRTVLVAIAMWSLFTVLTGFAWSLGALIIIRILFGIGEGAYPSASLKQITEEFPYEQRSAATSSTISSNYVGAAIAPMIVAPFIATLGWRAAFHTMGIIGIIFVIVYAFVLRPKKQAQAAAAGVAGKKVPWKQILTNGMLWKFFLVVFGLSVITKGLDSWMPTYLLQARHITLAGIAWMVPMPSIAAGIGAIAAGFIMTKWFKGHEKLMLALTSLCATIFMFGMYMSTSVGAVIGFEIATYFFKSLAFAGTFSLFAELVAKDEYGSAVGIVNFGGQIAGFIAPIVIGYMVTLFNGSYSAAFLFIVFAAALAFVSSLSISSSKIKERKAAVSASDSVKLAEGEE